MSILSTVKKGYMTIKTAAGYVKLLPRTLATLVAMSDGKSVEEKITELNSKLTGNHMHLTENSNGSLELPSGFKLVYGTYPASALVSDATVGGYSVTVPLAKYKLTSPLFANATAIYPGGFPRVAIHSTASDSLKIGCDVNVKNCYIHWMVIG